MIGQFYQKTIGLGDFSAFAILFFGALLGWIYLKPFLESKDDLYYYKRTLKKLKNYPVIFELLLTQSMKISNPTDELGIQFKTTSPKFQVIKVCSPFCGSCAKVHPELERLVETGSIDLQIIFFPNGKMDDINTKTISHFLAINNKGDNKVTQEALNIWYTAKNKQQLRLKTISL